MNDILLMNVTECINDFCQDGYCYRSWNCVYFIYEVKEGTSIKVFKDKTNIIFFLEEIITFDNMRMIKTSVQFNFLDESINHVVLS